MLNIPSKFVYLYNKFSYTMEIVQQFAAQGTPIDILQVRTLLYINYI